jgi:hypothetical protein
MKQSFGTKNSDGKKRVTLNRGTPIEICLNDINFSAFEARNDPQRSQVKSAQAEVTFKPRQKAATFSGHSPEGNTTF